MRPSLAIARRATIATLAALVAGCSNASSDLAGGAPQLIAGHAGGIPGRLVEYVYVTNFGFGNVSAYAIAASGALTPVTGSDRKSVV